MQANAHNSPVPGTDLPTLDLIRGGFPERPAFGTAVSEAILLRVGEGDLGATFRLHRPARELAFSKQDRAAPGFATAVAAARASGFKPLIRLAGGRAALFHEGSLAFAWSAPAERPTAGTRDRFAHAAEIVTAALERLGVDARIGAVPGEYCPGAWSINAGGRIKLVGIGQRIVSGAAHIGGVVIVHDSRLVRETLGPVYAALDLDWDPASAGAIEDAVPGVSLEQVEDAIIAELGARYAIREAGFDPQTLALADARAAEHEAPASP